MYFHSIIYHIKFIYHMFYAINSTPFILFYFILFYFILFRMVKLPFILFRMVRNYVCNTQRANWNEDQMRLVYLCSWEERTVNTKSCNCLRSTKGCIKSPSQRRLKNVSLEGIKMLYDVIELFLHLIKRKRWRITLLRWIKYSMVYLSMNIVKKI